MGGWSGGQVVRWSGGWVADAGCRNGVGSMVRNGDCCAGKGPRRRFDGKDGRRPRKWGMGGLKRILGFPNFQEAYGGFGNGSGPPEFQESL